MAVLAVPPALAGAWYLLRALALRRPAARRAVAALQPYTRFLHGWVLSAPATFGYMATFSATTVLQAAAPDRLIDLLTAFQSTSLARMRHHPVAALVTSALWVADQGSGLWEYLLVFGVVVAWTERRLGSPRIMVVGACAHVFGSLLTNAVKHLAIANEHSAHYLAIATDVGVSYLMVGCCGAALLVARGLWRAGIAAGLALSVLLPAVVGHTVWNLGHLFAAVCGTAAGAVLLRIAPPRRPPRFDASLPEPAPVAASPGPGRDGDRHDGPPHAPDPSRNQDGTERGDGAAPEGGGDGPSRDGGRRQPPGRASPGG